MSTLTDLLEAAKHFDRDHPPTDLPGWRLLNFNDGEGTAYFVCRVTGRTRKIDVTGHVDLGWL